MCVAYPALHVELYCLTSQQSKGVNCAGQCIPQADPYHLLSVCRSRRSSHWICTEVLSHPSSKFQAHTDKSNDQKCEKRKTNPSVHPSKIMFCLSLLQYMAINDDMSFEYENSSVQSVQASLITSLPRKPQHKIHKAVRFGLHGGAWELGVRRFSAWQPYKLDEGRLENVCSTTATNWTRSWKYNGLS
jgi:hypothetical protein